MTELTIDGTSYIVEQDADGYWYYRNDYNQSFGKKVLLKGNYLLVWNSGYSIFSDTSENSKLNVGSVAVYKRDGLGTFSYHRLFNLSDYVFSDNTIHIDDNISFGSSFDIIGSHLFVGCPYESSYTETSTDWSTYSVIEPSGGWLYEFDPNLGTSGEAFDLLATIMHDLQTTVGSYTITEPAGGWLRGLDPSTCSIGEFMDVVATLAHDLSTLTEQYSVIEPASWLRTFDPDTSTFGNACDVLATITNELFSTSIVDWKNKNLGSVYVFNIETGALLQKILPDNTPGQYTRGTTAYNVVRSHNFGYSMCAETDYLIIGAPGYSSHSAGATKNNSGTAYMYKYNPSDAEYQLSYTFSATSTIDGNRFGNYVDCNNDFSVVGSAPPASSSQAGYTKFYEINSTRDDIVDTVTIQNTHYSTNSDIKVNNRQIAISNPSADTVKIYSISGDVSDLSYTVQDNLIESFGVGASIEFDEEYLIAGCPNGYRKLGIVLRFQNIGQKYTLV